MDKEQTLKILNALANGVHPATGEKFAADGPYQHPDTVRALFEAMRAVEGGPAAAPAPERKPVLPQSGSGSRWSERRSCSNRGLSTRIAVSAITFLPTYWVRSSRTRPTTRT